jgi:thiamine pyrophosphate-dependent acetolactate synthase large subunit-like protein
VATGSQATRRALAAAGIDALYGDPGERDLGIDVVPVASPALAALLAVAHGRVFGRPALAVHGAIPCLDGDARAERRVDADPEVIAQIAGAERPVVLAGPGVVTEGAVAGLHALATAGSLGVLNTWGAKGVFDWRSPHHLATVGLQARDFELGGCSDADLVIATGVDDDEAPPALWQHAPHVVVAPGALDPIAEVLDRPHSAPRVPELRTALAGVTQEGWARSGAPLAPSQATRAYGAVVGAARGLVAADPGWAGYWVARTFPTVELGSAIVPADAGAAGFAAACALVARLRQPLRPVVVAVDRLDPGTEAVVDLAHELGAGFGVEVWTDDGDEIDEAAHADRLRDLAVAATPTVATLATHADQRGRMLDAAGPVVAWGGLEP